MKIHISLFIAAALLGVLSPSTCRGQVAQAPKPTPPRPWTALPESRTIELSPQAIDPLKFRYRFWPAPESRVSRNFMVAASRAIALMPTNTDWRQDFFAQWNQNRDNPIASIDVEACRKAIEPLDNAVDELMRSENWMTIDYDLGLADMEVAEHVSLLVPEFQEWRILGIAIALRSRIAAAQQDWDEFARTCRVGFRLAHAVSQCTDLLVGRAIGFSIAGIVQSAVFAAIESPGCPNFYWALATVPADELYEVRSALEYESTLMIRSFADVIGDLPDEPIGEVESRGRIVNVIDRLREIRLVLDDEVPSSEQMRIEGGLFVLAMATPARERLARMNQWRDRAASLSASEAVLRASAQIIRELDDEAATLRSVPESVWLKQFLSREFAVPETSILEKQVRELHNQLMPAWASSLTMSRSQRQMLHLLVTIESLRHRASVDGVFPESIDYIHDAPSWPDPMVGKPFEWKSNGSGSGYIYAAVRFSGSDTLAYNLKLRDHP